MNQIEVTEEYNLNDVVLGVSAIALGMTVRVGRNSRWANYSIDGQHAFCTHGMRLPIDTPVVIEQANDKILARARMEAAGLPVLPFSIVDCKSPVLPSADGDWTLKVPNGKQGSGVICRIPTSKLPSCVSHLATLNRILLLEQTIHGPTYRFLVLEGEVIDAYVTSAPPLVGDGRRTVAQIVSEYADRAARGHGIHVRFDYEVNHALEMQGLTGDSVVQDGRVFQHTFVSNISRGGVWNRIRWDGEFERQARIAQRASKAVGLRLCGVDLIESSSGEVFVLEANPSPGIARFTWTCRPDFVIESIDLGAPISILQAMLRASNLSSCSKSPRFVTLSVAEFNEHAASLLSADS